MVNLFRTECRIWSAGTWKRATGRCARMWQPVALLGSVVRIHARQLVCCACTPDQLSGTHVHDKTQKSSWPQRTCLHRGLCVPSLAMCHRFNITDIYRICLIQKGISWAADLMSKYIVLNKDLCLGSLTDFSGQQLLMNKRSKNKSWNIIVVSIEFSGERNLIRIFLLLKLSNHSSCLIYAISIKEML